MKNVVAQIFRCHRIVRTFAALAVACAAVTAPAQAADGPLDPTFGVGGTLTTDFLGGHDRGTSMAIQPDGKIVVAGIVDDNALWPPPSVIAVFRYNADGTLDATFGTGGKVALDFFPVQTSPSEREGVAVALQPDGRIVIAGSVAPPYTYADFGVARLTASGALDPTFGGGAGWVTTDFGSPSDPFPTGDGATSVAIQSNGKIVAAGFARLNGGFSDFAVARYNADGTLDSSFGNGTGKVTVDFLGADDWANSVAIQADGKIVAAGVASDATYRRAFGVAQLAPDGTLDSTFAGTGRVRTVIATTNQYEYYEAANALAIQPLDGKIVVAGYAYINAIGSPTQSYLDFALVRYNPNGTLDSTFGVGGKALTDFAGEFDVANAVALQADGRIVAAGYHSYLSNVETHVDFMVVRYTADGVPDATFGTNGVVLTPFDGADAAQSIAIQSDCKIVVAGYTWPVSLTEWGEQFEYDANFALARYDGGVCAAPPPAYRCPLSQGFWGTHPSTWPISSMALGVQSYSKKDLLAVLASSTSGDASVVLAQQLIAAKLNVANGSDPTPVASVIADADALLSGFAGTLPYKLKTSSPIGRLMTADANILERYNLGQLTPSCNP
jgi:uncharacterized delta-60 repeat protein